jgi:hypothetical protein
MAYGSTYIIIIFNLVPSNYNTESSLHIVNLWLHAFDGLHFCGIPGSCRCPHRLVVTPGYRSSLRAAVGLPLAARKAGIPSKAWHISSFQFFFCALAHQMMPSLTNIAVRILMVSSFLPRGVDFIQNKLPSKPISIKSPRISHSIFISDSIK